ncbi:MAG: lipopolysaccharide biosynthesis protein [Clostridia bacterium]|nr:lipopolysaccharide biosynthesis protein [Clostridia bacterium]MBR6860321.1 lipopolysaccharide biosynthesis protein [Acidaminococcaceae bacterium]
MGRTEKSIRNLKFALAAQVVTIALSFVTRTCLVRILGIEAVALNGLFTQVIAAISLAEMGTGTAIVYNLYKPLAEGDHEKVSQLMNLFRTAYWIIGAATMVIGIILIPWLPYLITDLPNDISYIRIVYLMFVFQSAVSYLFSYKISLMQADQNGYIYTRIYTVFKLVGTVLVLIALLFSKNFLVFLGANILLTVVTNAYASHVAQKKYPYIDKRAKLPKEEKRQIFSNIRNLFIMQFAGRVVDSTDNILISSMISTILVGLYSNYMVVIGVFKQLSDKLMVAASASMGNLFVTDDTDGKERNLYRLTFIFYIFASIACVGTYSCIQPFIHIWLGGDYLLEMPVVFVLCFLYFVAIIYEPLKNAMYLTGYFAIGRNISFASAMTNLIVSIILGRQIGLIGIFIGTMCTYVIEIVTKTYYLFKLYLKRGARPYVLLWIRMTLVFLAELGVVHIISSRLVLSALPAFLVMGLLSVLITVIAVTAVFFKTDLYAYVLWLLKTNFAKILSRLSKQSQ